MVWQHPLLLQPLLRGSVGTPLSSHGDPALLFPWEHYSQETCGARGDPASPRQPPLAGTTGLQGSSCGTRGRGEGAGSIAGTVLPRRRSEDGLGGGVEAAPQRAAAGDPRGRLPARRDRPFRAQGMQGANLAQPSQLPADAAAGGEKAAGDGGAAGGLRRRKIQLHGEGFRMAGICWCLSQQVKPRQKQGLKTHGAHRPFSVLPGSGPPRTPRCGVCWLYPGLALARRRLDCPVTAFGGTDQTWFIQRNLPNQR